MPLHVPDEAPPPASHDPTTARQLPTLPLWLQLRQSVAVLPQSDPQQTPSEQKPDAHCVPLVHVTPVAFLTHVLLLQTGRLLGQSPSLLHSAQPVPFERHT